MDEREGGFIVLHRRIRSWPLWYFLSAEQRMVFVTLLLDANWKDSEAWIGASRIPVKRGQLIHSEETIARHAGVSRKVVRTTLTKLVHEGAVVREQAHGGARSPHLLTVVNYAKYQDVKEDEGPPEGQAGAKQGPSVGQAGAPSEQGKPEEQVSFLGADAPPAPANGTTRRSKKRPEDPVVEALKADLSEMHVRVRGAALDWPPSAYGDLAAIRKALADDDELKRRWDLFLRDTFWPLKSINRFRVAFPHPKFIRRPELERAAKAIPEYR